MLHYSTHKIFCIHNERGSLAINKSLIMFIACSFDLSAHIWPSEKNSNLISHLVHRSCTEWKMFTNNWFPGPRHAFFWTPNVLFRLDHLAKKKLNNKVWSTRNFHLNPAQLCQTPVEVDKWTLSFWTIFNF